MMKTLASLVFLCGPASAAVEPSRIYLPQSLRANISEINFTPAAIKTFVKEMPKVETHVHLDGALSVNTVRDLAVEQNYEPLASKTLAEIEQLTVVTKPRKSLGRVLNAFNAIYPLLHTPQALEKIAYDALASARGQNIRYMEVRFAPTLQATKDFSQEQVLKAALKGLKRGERDFGIKSGVIICLIRPFDFVSREKNEEMLELAIRYHGRGVVGIDLAGNEAAAPLSAFKEYYIRAKQAGLLLTVHAGETPDSPDLETALELEVDRLGHATLLAQKPRLLKRVRKLGIPIEVNLTSNRRTSAIKRYTDHPVKDWYPAGIPVLLSTDDPGVFGIDLDEEYLRLATQLHFSAPDLLTVAFQGIDGLFLPDQEKREMRRRFETEVQGVLANIRERQRPGR